MVPFDSAISMPCGGCARFSDPFTLRNDDVVLMETAYDFEVNLQIINNMQATGKTFRFDLPELVIFS